MPLRLSKSQAKRYGLQLGARPKAPPPRERYGGYASPLEVEFAAYLDHCGLYRVVRYEPWQFVLIAGPKPVRYTPDFLAIPEDTTRRWVLFEVKGFWRPKNRVIMKLCADRWGKEFAIIGVMKVNRQWDFEEFS